MKKLIISFGFIFVLFLSVSGQTDQASVMVGGSLGVSFHKAYSSSQYKDLSYRAISIQPIVGYFLLDNFAFGLSPSYTSTTTTVSQTDYTSEDYSVCPFARFYVGNSTTKFFAHAEYGFLRQKFSSNSNTGNSWGSSNGSETQEGTILSVGAGIAGFLTENVALEGKVMYINQQIEDKSNPKGVFFSLGFQIHFSE